MNLSTRLSITAFAVAAMLPCSFAFGQQFGGGQQPPPRNGPPVSAATTSLVTLTTALTLSSSQQTQIGEIQSAAKDKLQALLPVGPGGGFGGGQPQGGPGGDGQQGGGPQFGQGGGPGFGRPAGLDSATRAKIQTIEDSATTQINAVLSQSQQAELTALVGQLKDLQSVGISPRLFGKLKLSSDQLTQISAIAAQAKSDTKSALESAASSGEFDSVQQSIQAVREKARTSALAVLTADQAAIVKADRPMGRRGFGGPPQGGQGGFGGPQQGDQSQAGFGGPGGPGGQDGGPGGQDGGPGGQDGGPAPDGQGAGGPPNGGGSDNSQAF